MFERYSKIICDLVTQHSYYSVTLFSTPCICMHEKCLYIVSISEIFAVMLTGIKQ